MAMSLQKNGVLLTVSENGESYKYHRAVLGGFVHDDTGRLYGLTCKHVTRAACDGNVYTQMQSGDTIKIGHIIRPVTNKMDDDPTDGIDVIEIYRDRYHLCDIHYTFQKGDFSSVKLFKGPNASIYGRTIYMLSPSQLFQENCDSKVVYSLVSGMVATAACHERYKGILQNVESQFLVEGFGTPGDSGSIVAFINDDGSLELVGMVMGGQKSQVDQTICYQFTLCSNLHALPRTLGLRYGRTFRIFCRGTKKERSSCIKPGCLILVKSPYRIKKADFDLLERMQMLMECIGQKRMLSSKEEEEQTQFQIMWSSVVSGGRDVSVDLLSNPTNDQACYLNCMVACRHIYKGHYQQSKKYLKDACRLLPRTSFPNRLLCKIITYVTWQFLETGDLHRIGILLEVATDYMQKSVKRKMCPVGSYGFLHYDFARYYIAKKMYPEAKKKARESFRFFLLNKSVKHGQVFALMLLADILLRCDEEFQNHDRKVPAEDINVAEEILHQAKLVGKRDPAEDVCYLMTSADLCYRKGDFTKALYIAKKTLTVAVENKFDEEIYQSNVRIATIRSAMHKSGCGRCLLSENKC